MNGLLIKDIILKGEVIFIDISKYSIVLKFWVWIKLCLCDSKFIINLSIDDVLKVVEF